MREKKNRRLTLVGPFLSVQVWRQFTPLVLSAWITLAPLAQRGDLFTGRVGRPRRESAEIGRERMGAVNPCLAGGEVTRRSRVRSRCSSPRNGAE